MVLFLPDPPIPTDRIRAGRARSVHITATPTTVEIRRDKDQRPYLTLCKHNPANYAPNQNRNGN